MDPRDANERQQELIDAARRQVHGERSDATINVGSQYAETVPADSPSGPPPDSFAGYKIVREIHRGGQGVVYQAFQESTKRKVAIKVMKEGPFAGSADKARFEREVQILGQLKHPNIVTIYDSGEAAGHFYFVMDYISGQPLDVYMSSGERSIEETLKLFGKICDAVNAAHLKGVIHRDLKPGNVRIDDNGEPYILDFGLAKVAVSDQEASLMTMTGQFIGSLPWSSPEQAEGKPGKIDVRTDVYSLGVILYQMLTGKFPYEVVGNMRDVLDRIMKAEPAKPSTIRKQINDEVETIVLKCLSKERERRYQTAGELGRDVRRYLSGEPIEAKRDSGWYVLRKVLRRYRVRASVAAGFVLVISAGFVTSLLFAQQAIKERRRAEQEAEWARIAAADAREVSRFTCDMLSSINPLISPELGGLDTTLMEAILADAARRIETELSDQPEVAASVRTAIGRTYFAIGEYEAAQPHLEAALELRRREFGDDHPDTLRAMNALASLLCDRGQYDQAEELSLRALELSRRALGEEHRITLVAIDRLGVVYGCQGHYLRAEELFRQALEAREHLFGSEDPDTLASMYSLAELYRRQKRFEEAEPLMRQALEIRRRVLGEQHPDTWESMNVLAQLLKDQQHYDEAEQLYLQTLERRRRVLGSDHPHTLVATVNLATLYVHQKRYEDAEPQYVEALDSSRRVLGEEHPITLSFMGQLANLYLRQARPEEAEALYIRVLEARRRIFGDEHRTTMTTAGNLGWLYYRLGRFDEAEPLLLESLEGRRRIYGDDHEDTLTGYYRLAALYMMTERYEEAERSALRYYEGSAAQSGPTHSNTRAGIRLLAKLYDAWGRPDTAAEWWSRLESTGATRPREQP